MITCIILHNIKIKNECQLDAPIEVGREAPYIDIKIVAYENVQF